MKRHLPAAFVFLAVSLLVADSIGQAAAAEPRRPNVVFILADDLGYGDLGCYGCRDVKTPNVDRLAAAGVRFTHFYANGPECSPTRAALLTGRYQQRVGGFECALGVGNVGRYDDAIRLRKTNDLGLPATPPTLPRLLKEGGYATAICGKWHLGYEDKQSQAPPKVYAAMIERLDHAVGKVVEELEKQKLTDNTVIVFTSDNGGTASARPTSLRGIKGSTFEGGIRVPCIVSWPNVLPAKTVTDQVALTMDLTAAVARIAGVAAPREAPFDGIDVLDRVAKKQPNLERTVFWRGRRGDRTWWAVRSGSLKYVAQRDGEKKVEYLFDLREDGGETKNLLDQRPDDATRLRRELVEWEKQVRPTR